MFKIVSGGEVATVLATKKAWQGGGPLDVFMLGHGVQQLWARYFEEANISTKIRLGQVEIEIRMAIHAF